MKLEKKFTRLQDFELNALMNIGPIEHKPNIRLKK